MRLAFSGGVFNEYRIAENRQVEFRIGGGQWRTLDASEIELHYILHTEVSKWLGRVLDNAKRTGEASG